MAEVFAASLLRGFLWLYARPWGASFTKRFISLQELRLEESSRWELLAASIRASRLPLQTCYSCTWYTDRGSSKRAGTHLWQNGSTRNMPRKPWKRFCRPILEKQNLLVCLLPC